MDPARRQRYPRLPICGSYPPGTRFPPSIAMQRVERYGQWMFENEYGSAADDRMAENITFGMPRLLTSGRVVPYRPVETLCGGYVGREKLGFQKGGQGFPTNYLFLNPPPPPPPKDRVCW